MSSYFISIMFSEAYAKSVTFSMSVVLFREGYWPRKRRQRSRLHLLGAGVYLLAPVIAINRKLTSYALHKQPHPKLG